MQVLQPTYILLHPVTMQMPVQLLHLIKRYQIPTQLHIWHDNIYSNRSDIFYGNLYYKKIPVTLLTK